MLTAKNFTYFLHNRYGVAFFTLLAIAGVLFAAMHGVVSPPEGDYGLIMPSPNNWLVFGVPSAAICIILNIAVGLSSIGLNKQYNTMRSLSMLVASAFMVMQLASPSILGSLNGSVVMAVGISVITLLLFSMFADPYQTRRVYLIFLLLAVFSLFEYSFLLYIPILLTGLSQMRIFCLKTFMAALLGLVTPAWILFGFGIITFTDIRIPEFQNFLTAINTSGMWFQILVTGITVVIGLSFMMMNAMKMLSYNSRIRAANGFLTLLMLATMLFSFVDYNNILVYSTLLNILVAYQVGHYFATHIDSPRSYIGVVVVYAVYFGVFALRFYI